MIEMKDAQVVNINEIKSMVLTLNVILNVIHGRLLYNDVVFN